MASRYCQSILPKPADPTSLGPNTPPPLRPRTPTWWQLLCGSLWHALCVDWHHHGPLGGGHGDHLGGHRTMRHACSTTHTTCLDTILDTLECSKWVYGTHAACSVCVVYVCIQRPAHTRSHCGLKMLTLSQMLEGQCASPLLYRFSSDTCTHAVQAVHQPANVSKANSVCVWGGGGG
jgi:hypothetical protein